MTHNYRLKAFHGYSRGFDEGHRGEGRTGDQTIAAVEEPAKVRGVHSFHVLVGMNVCGGADRVGPFGQRTEQQNAMNVPVLVEAIDRLFELFGAGVRGEQQLAEGNVQALRLFFLIGRINVDIARGTFGRDSGESDPCGRKGFYLFSYLFPDRSCDLSSVDQVRSHEGRFSSVFSPALSV